MEIKILLTQNVWDFDYYVTFALIVNLFLKWIGIKNNLWHSLSPFWVMNAKKLNLTY